MKRPDNMSIAQEGRQLNNGSSGWLDNDCACAFSGPLVVDTFLQNNSKYGQKPQTIPLICWLHITDRCNLRCDYCYLPHLRADMNYETGQACIESAFRSAQNHRFPSLKIKYGGGEPLLRFPLISELHQHALKQASLLSIDVDGVVLTNGTLLTTDKIDIMKALGLRLMISMDGVGQYHDCQRPYIGGRSSANDVQYAVELAQEAALPLSVSITISSRNIAGFPEFVRWALERKLRFNVNFYRENDYSASLSDLKLIDEKIISGMKAAFQLIAENPPYFSLLGALTDRANLSAHHLHSCGVSQNYLVFNTNGTITKCHMQLDQSTTYKKEKDPLTFIQEMRYGIQNKSVDEKVECSICEWRYWCGGGCPLANYRATGRYDTKSPYCNIYKELFPEVLKLEKLRLGRNPSIPEMI
jgi:uncharacterized protein